MHIFNIISFGNLTHGKNNNMYYQLEMNDLKLMAKANFTWFKFNPRLKSGAIKSPIIIGFSY